MKPMIRWMQNREQQLFYFINHTLRHVALDRIMIKVTHLGGATFTITFSVLISLFFLYKNASWNSIGSQSLIALILSHIPVAIFKKCYPRLRPYLVLKHTNICNTPLTDYSFPSGHTTAFFSVIVPFAIAIPWTSLFLLPLALLVGISRIYLGLHYPSDVVVGCLTGSGTAIISVAFFS